MIVTPFAQVGVPRQPPASNAQREPCLLLLSTALPTGLGQSQDGP